MVELAFDQIRPRKDRTVKLGSKLEKSKLTQLGDRNALKTEPRRRLTRAT